MSDSCVWQDPAGCKGASTVQSEARIAPQLTNQRPVFRLRPRRPQMRLGQAWEAGAVGRWHTQSMADSNFSQVNTVNRACELHM